MSLFDLRVVDPANPDEYLEYLDGWSNLSATVDRKAPGVLRFTYPINGINRAQLRDKQVVAFLQDGEEGESCRYVIRNRDVDSVVTDGITTETYEFKSLWDALRDAVYEAPGGTTKTRSWTNFTAGTQLVEVMKATAARGTFNWWGYQGLTFDAKRDSSGEPWPIIESMEHQYGISIFDVWDWLVHNHWIEVSTTGGQLNAYVPDSRGADKTAQTFPVILSQGKDLADAPEQETFDDFVTDVYVIGGETTDPNDETKLRPKLYRWVRSGVTGWGRRERSWTVSGVQSTATLDKIGAAYLKGFGAPRSSRTYAIKQTDSPPPPVAVSTPVPKEWTPYLTLPLQDTKIWIQGVAADPQTSELYVYQADDPNEIMTVSKYSAAGVYQSKMVFPGGGHPSMMHIVRPTLSDQPLLWWNYGNGDAADYWVKIPWVAGRTWTAAQVLPYKDVSPPRSGVATQTWFQGETWFDHPGPPVLRKFYKFYGTAYTAKGSTRTPAYPARIDVTVGKDIVEVMDLAHVGYDSKGIPIGGRREPEGISILYQGGKPYLLTGWSTGPEGTYGAITYIYPLFDETTTVVTQGRVAVPMVDYGAGDFIGIDLADGTGFRKERVEIITAQADARNVGEYLITVGDWLDGRDEKLDRLLQKYDGGSN